ncbi:DUF6763 family protein [Kangiella koreensis]|uniref:Uncharacterized protein n=1 Tax=Kangiella koreensis (strain DSM 16069 / JCM 12317 / KCTC 12182 / SW-125) TaxID=523791 RepID=C7RCE3_KANKD|nr:DUF6763 family protein [Kangiella koreensis]ACV26935.1 hypothetical protein Kkor_1523 [Kangiella koreensis DSM 16069]
MAQELLPLRGHWYKRSDLNTIFEVVAIDDDDGTIEVQYFGGEIEELDLHSWELLELSQAAPPEDWSGALEVDDYTLGDELELAPGSLDDVLNIIDSNDH